MKALVRDIKEIVLGQLVAVDTETVSLKDKTLVGMSMYDGKNAYFLSTEVLGIDTIVRFIKPFLHGKATKIFHNAKFDLAVFRKYGIHTINFEDTLILAWLCDTGTRKKFGLKELASEVLHVSMTKLKDIGFKGNTSEVDLELLADYAMDDVIYTYELYRRYRPKVSGVLEKDYKKIELPIVEILSNMEEKGILVDLEHLEKLHYEMGKATTKMFQDLVLEMRDSGYVPKNKREITPNSPQQVTEFLAKKGIKIDSAQRKELEHIDDPWVQKLLQYKKDFKLFSTYVHNLLPEIKESGGRLKGSFNQTGTDTGRFSSSRPNLQNLPAHDAYSYRSIFIPSPKHKLIVADYSQIELRTLAHLSKDALMIEYFKAGYDLHSATAHAMFNLDCPVEEVKDRYGEVRFKAKAINFGLIYGMGPAKLGETINVSEGEAIYLIEQYFEQFPSIKKYIEHVQQKAVQLGHVTTIFGRRRFFPDLFSEDPEIRRKSYGATLRRAINTKIQGSAADIMKAAMIKVSRLGVDILLQVHDEIVVEVPEDKAEKYKQSIKYEMEHAVTGFRVPLDVSIAIANNWEEGK